MLDAFDFVSVDSPYDQGAYINPATGAIFYVSPEIEAESETPDDFETSDRYIAVPHKKDFNLGRDLVFSFVDDELPEHFETVAGFFRRKGAYRRFKDFLDRRDLLDQWHAFESRATENELRAWAKAQGIEFTDEQTQTDQQSTPDAPRPCTSRKSRGNTWLSFTTTRCSTAVHRLNLTFSSISGYRRRRCTR